MFDAKLIINGKEFPVHYKLLSVLAENIPDGKHYAPIVQALLALGIPSITRELIGNDALSIADLDEIWEKGDLDLKRRLADEATFRKNLTDAQAEQIIKINDKEILKSLAGFAEELYPDKDEEQATRLSGKMADSLLEFMASHPDMEVRQELAENRETPAKFRPSFAEKVKIGLTMWGALADSLGPDDLDILRTSSLETRKAVAESVESIQDKETRAKVIDFLCSSPDPAIRLELAENCSAPKSALRRLADDPDLDVAQAARDNLHEE